MINYLKGDATDPIKKPAVIVHICNDIGKWGKGFVMAVSKKWPSVRERYINWYANGIIQDNPFKLGRVQFVQVNGDIVIANMIGQEGIYSKDGDSPIRYDAIRKCLEKVSTFNSSLSVHMPRIGCGLAGGKWNLVEQIVKDTLKDFDVYVYDYD